MFTSLFRGLLALFFVLPIQGTFAQIYLRFDELHITYYKLPSELFMVYAQKGRHSFIQNLRINFMAEPQFPEAHFRRDQTEYYPIIMDTILKYEVLEYYYLGECEENYAPVEMNSRELSQIYLSFMPISQLNLKKASITFEPTPSGFDRCIGGLPYYELHLPSKDEQFIPNITAFTKNALGQIYDSLTFSFLRTQTISIVFPDAKQAQAFLKELRQRQKAIESRARRAQGPAPTRQRRRS